MGQLWSPVAPQPYVVQKSSPTSETPWPLDYNSQPLHSAHPLHCIYVMYVVCFDFYCFFHLLFGPQAASLLLNWLNSISLQCIPWPCSLLWVRYLFDPLILSGFGANDPWMENFHKFMSEFCVSFTNFAKTVAKLPKSRLVLPTKKDTRQGHFLAPHFAPLNRSRPEFRERCRSLTWVCVPTLVQIGCVLPDLFRKGSKSQYNIGFQPTITSHTRRPFLSSLTWFTGA